MTTWDLERVTTLMIEAGKIARSFFGSCSRTFKEDQSIVTEADYAVEHFWASHLDKPENHSYLLGEETISGKSETYVREAFQCAAWVIDPIDGTAVFAHRLPHWGLSVGLMQEGVLCEGMIFLAALGELYYTQKGKVYKEELGSNTDFWFSKRGNPIQLIAVSNQLIPGSMIGLGQLDLCPKHKNFPYHVQLIGSAVFNMTKLADGSLGALITSFRLWDFAAGLPMLYYLGWTMEYLSLPGTMSLKMDKKTLCLDPKHPCRWQVVNPLIFAPSSQDADNLRQILLES